MIDALLFDIDGVLVNEEKKWFSFFLEEEYGIPHALLDDFFQHEFLECVDGKKDLRAILPKYLQLWQWHVTVDEALHYWHTKEHLINEPLIAEMQSYKDLGLRLYTATNQEIYRTNYIRDEMGFGKLFDEVIASSMLGHRKPVKAYFEKILKRIRISAEDTLFWDDKEENIEAARALGMNAEHYKNFQDFKQVMKERYNL